MLAMRWCDRFASSGLTSVAALARAVLPLASSADDSTVTTTDPATVPFLSGTPDNSSVSRSEIAPEMTMPDDARGGGGGTSADDTDDGIGTADGDDLSLDVVAKQLFNVGVALATRAGSAGPVHVSVTLGKRGFAWVSLDRNLGTRTVCHGR